MLSCLDTKPPHAPSKYSVGRKLMDTIHISVVTSLFKHVLLYNNQVIAHSPSRWIAYSHVDFSGNQYILEKGFYNNCADWGSQDTRICSVQPILLVRTTMRRRTQTSKQDLMSFIWYSYLSLCLFSGSK